MASLLETNVKTSVDKFLRISQNANVELTREGMGKNVTQPKGDSMLMSAFLLRFKANYLEKMRGYPYFSFWIPIAFAQDLLFAHGPNLAQKPPYLLGTVLKNVEITGVTLKDSESDKKCMLFNKFAVRFHIKYSREIGKSLERLTRIKL